MTKRIAYWKRKLKLRKFTPQQLPGVYFLCRGNDIIYIGTSCNIIDRVSQHWRKFNDLFDSVYYYPVADARERLMSEYKFITTIKPSHNRAHTARVGAKGGPRRLGV